MLFRTANLSQPIGFKDLIKIAAIGLLSAFLLVSEAARAGEIEERVDVLIDKFNSEIGAVPGFSVAIVNSEGPILVKGYGLTKLEDGRPVDENTQFYIASSTKSLTGMAIASLAQKGLLDVDIPISNYLPEAPETVNRVTLRELLSHTAGLESEAMTWRTAFSGDHDQQTLLEVFYASTPAEPGKTFAYDNFGYNVASLILEEVFQKSWKEIVFEEVLEPLNMSRTTSYISRLNMENVAFPHGWFGKIHLLPIVKKDNTMHAAGGHFTTAADMAVWLSALLQQGNQAIDSGTVETALEPTATLGADFYRFKRKAYGMGWYVAEYGDTEIWQQFGSFSGYRSHVSFSPSLGIGVAVMINELSPASFYQPDMIASLVYDIAMGIENSEEALYQELTATKERMAPMVGRDFPVRPRNAPENETIYAGDFFNAEFGTFSFFIKDGELWGKFGNLESATTYKEDGSVRIELLPYEGTLVFFEEGADGEIVGLRYRGANYRKIIP